MPKPSTPRGLHLHSPRADAAQRLLTQRLSDVLRAQEKLKASLDPDPVHDLRIATRRLRAALNVFRPLGGLKGLERRVKHLQDALGEVRDIHVQSEWLRGIAADQKPARRAGPEALRSKLESQLGARERELRLALERWTHETVPAIQQEAERLEGPGRYGDKEDRGKLLHRMKQMKRHLRTYQNAPHPLLAHELRKSVKKLRYEAELFHHALPEDMDGLLKILEPLQKSLGRLHDSDVRMGVLDRFITDGSSAQRDAARKLLDQVSDEREGHASQVDEDLHSWQSKKRFRQLKRLLE